MVVVVVVGGRRDGGEGEAQRKVPHQTVHNRRCQWREGGGRWKESKGCNAQKEASSSASAGLDRSDRPDMGFLTRGAAWRVLFTACAFPGEYLLPFYEWPTN